MKDVEKATDDAIKKIEGLSDAELEASIKLGVEESDEDIETDNSNWQRGELILLKGIEVIYKGRFDRPFIGRVANNGTFIFDDEMIGGGLQSTLWAYNSSGQKLIRHQFSANMKTLDISDNGHYAICQMAHSQTVDGNIMALFDLESGILL